MLARHDTGHGVRRSSRLARLTDRRIGGITDLLSASEERGIEQSCGHGKGPLTRSWQAVVQVAERALFLWNNEAVVALVAQHSSQVTIPRAAGTVPPPRPARHSP